jgi:hypothetical protein
VTNTAQKGWVLIKKEMMLDLNDVLALNEPGQWVIIKGFG